MTIDKTKKNTTNTKVTPKTIGIQFFVVESNRKLR